MRFCIIIYPLLSIIFYFTEVKTMSSNSIILEKSLDFAARIVKLNRYLVNEKKETVISKQIIRSGTSIGANANEAIYGSSKADFIAKLQISLKETAETEYWIRLLIKTDCIIDLKGNIYTFTSNEQ